MIKIRNISKSYNNKKILKNLCLEINDGEITALVGKNGAGKSTLIKLIAGILKADSGTIELTAKSTVGILLGGDINLYNELTAYEIINFFGELYGLEKYEIENNINKLDNVLNIKSFIYNKANTYSRGMKQKIGLVISMIHDPDIILLDEPSTGLDIEAANDVISFIKYLKSLNKTILIATHNIFEISDLSDSIAFIADGNISEKVKTETFFLNYENSEKSELIIKGINNYGY